MEAIKKNYKEILAIAFVLTLLGIFFGVLPHFVNADKKRRVIPGGESNIVRQRRIAADRKRGIRNSHKLVPRIAF